MRRKRVILIVSALALVAIAIVCFTRFGRSLWAPVMTKLSGKRSVESVIADAGPSADAALRPAFDRAGVAYPPRELALLAFKQEKSLELWARVPAPGTGPGDTWTHITNFPIQAASGVAGPKLKEGDRQVPEGVYRIEHLNPNSSYHLSMKLDYPNAYDLARATADGRTNPGGDIFIHGKALSIGCLAMGDPAIEQLFTLVHRTGLEHTRVIIAPHDWRKTGPPKLANPTPVWVPELYGDIDAALREIAGN